MNRLLLLMTAIVCFGASTTSYAIPRFALWKGEANCLSCHANPTGGGIRNGGGEAFSKNILAMWKRGDEFSGQISEGIRFGANVRNQFLSFSQTFPMGDSLNVRDTTISNSTSHAMTAALMVDASLTNALHLYVRYDPIAGYNESYGTLHFVDETGEFIEAGSVVSHAYLKGGAFLPAFGIRFEDHTLYTRGGNRGVAGFGAAGSFWIDGYRDVGMEAGATFFDHVGLQVAYLNGSEQSPRANVSFNSDAALALRATASAEVIEDAFSFEVGGSMYLHTNVEPATDTDPAKDLSLTGIHLGLRGGPVTLLAEYDMGKNVYQAYTGEFVAKLQALTTELAVKVVQGLDIIGRYEMYKDLDEDDNEGNVVDSRITIGAQWFPIRFIEVRPEFRMAKYSTPTGSTRTEYDQLTYILQTHLYF
jgi:hypothetical protein